MPGWKNGGAVVGTSPVTVYTASAATVVRAIHCANVTGSQTTATVTWTDDSAAATYTLAHGHAVPSASAHQVLDGALVLETGDSIAVTAGAVDALHVTVSAMEP